MELANMQKHNILNHYKLCGTTRKGNPRYLKVIDFMFQNQDKAFSRSEMLLKSGYAVQNQIGHSINSRGSFCYLTSALNQNKIISYDRSIRKWKVGENFINWCLEYYPEIFEKNTNSKVETYKSDFLTEKYNKKNEDLKYEEYCWDFSQNTLVPKTIIDEVESRQDLVNRKEDIRNLLIESELKTIERSIKKIRELLEK